MIGLRHMKRQKLTIGLFGLGTVGTGLVKLLESRKVELKEHYGVEFHLKKVVVKNSNKERLVNLPEGVLTTNASDILDDSEIDTVIELIGGITPAKDIILTALKKKKNVVTGNKELLATFLDKILQEANKNNCHLGFRAAITGCHQIRDHLAYAGSIKNIIGVYSGTCNYILTEMENDKIELNEALKKAQQFGYAEKNPAMDIDGLDTAHKLILISRLAMGCLLKPKDFYIRGIRDINLDDMLIASELGYKFKLLGFLKNEDSKIDIRVHPTLIPKNSLLASIKGIENGIQIQDDVWGERGLVAEGAGMNPTASVVLTDLIEIAKDVTFYWPKKNNQFSIKREGLVKSKYYIRFNAVNKPGVLAKVASILGKQGINIRNVIQKGEELNSIVPIIMIVDESFSKDIEKALKKIDALPIVKKNSVSFRIEDGIS